MSNTRTILNQLPDFPHKNSDLKRPENMKLPPRRGKSETFFEFKWLVEPVILDDYIPRPTAKVAG